MRYWLGAGRGGFGLGSAECVRPSFYCAVFTTPLPARTMEPSGITVKTSKLVTAPDAASAVIKSVNYLRNAICQDEAEAAGYDVGVFVDEEGYVVDGSNASVGIITKAGEVVVPPFDRALAGITAGRVLELLPEARGGTGRGGRGRHPAPARVRPMSGVTRHTHDHSITIFRMSRTAALIPDRETPDRTTPTPNSWHAALRSRPLQTPPRPPPLSLQWVEASVVLKKQVTSISQRRLHISEAHNAREAFVMSSMRKVAPVLKWDDYFISDGNNAPLVMTCMRTLFDKDLDPHNGRGQHTEVPYDCVMGLASLGAARFKAGRE